MTKQEYFKLIRAIAKSLRAQGLEWVSTYSEPRKKTGYRTKLYYVYSDTYGEVLLSVWELAAQKFN